MSLTEEELGLVTAHLKKHWDDGACPLCKHHGWVVAGHLTFDLAETHLGFSSGRGLACIAVICRKCGNTVLVNTRVVMGTVGK